MFSGLPSTQPLARRWTAATSFALQSGLVAAVLVLPTLYTQSLPSVFLDHRIFVPMSGPVRTADPVAGSGSSEAPRPNVLVVAVHHFTIGKPHTNAGDASSDAPSLGPETGTGLHLGNWMLGTGPVVLPAPLPAPRPLVVSQVMAGNLIRRVEPQYPAIARQIHLEGTVVLNAIISREGNIERVDVASGPALLAGAAREAVRQWKYRPYLLNGEPVEVETQVTVNFVMGQ